MRALRLEAENFKRLSLVAIDLPSGVVEIAGNNGMGKTSILDVFSAVLGGADRIQWEPINKAADRAYGMLTIGDDAGVKFKITRLFKRVDGGPKTFTTSLKIEDARGERVRGEQSLLNALLGPISLDPAAFIRKKPGERLEDLKALIPDIDFAEIATKRQALYDDRTDIGREVKRLKGVLDTFPAVAVDAPAVEQRAGDLATALEAMIDHNGKVNTERADRERAERDLSDFEEEAADIDRKIAALVEDRDSALANAETLRTAAKKLKPLPKTHDAAAIFDMRDQIKAVEETNALVRQKAQRKAAVEDHAKAETNYADKTALIDALDDKVRKAIEDADLPVRGMTLGEHDVYLGGVPFDQASDAEQLRAALAIAMASSPELRLIRIRDGSLLDKKAMAVIAKVAKADDFQIVIERVDPSGPEAIIVEDGRIKE